MTVALQDHESGRFIIDSLVDAGAEAAAAQLPVLVRKRQKPDKAMWTKADLLFVLDAFYKDRTEYPWLQRVLRKTPIRSLSGITSITVLTKPFPCPGKCVFCPVDVRMPKSYIATEPGARRAGRLGFDPYEQVTQRLIAYAAMGHPTSKIELIVLGGTWSAYPRDYQLWFIKRLYEALNDFGIRHDETSHAYAFDWDERIAKGETYDAHVNKSHYVQEPYAESATQQELDEQHRINETATSRCVGLSLETRPDLLDAQECINLRSLGATKIQIGIQSLDDTILKMNKRGHSVAKTEKALRLLRRFGFKIHAHWMPNLYGATAAGDIEDYQRVFDNLSIRPDELKVYPTALIQDTELEQIANRGLWNPYSEEELYGVLGFVLTHTPEYARLTRIIRDIPASEILVGNKKGNFRQLVEGRTPDELMHDIRAREVKEQVITPGDLILDDEIYETTETTEHFIQYIRASDRKIAAFLRLSLPKNPGDHPLPELVDAAVIREVHVYGQSIVVGTGQDASQHQGLGTALVKESKERARAAGFSSIAVISAVGTRKYYEKLGFTEKELYHHSATN